MPSFSSVIFIFPTSSPRYPVPASIHCRTMVHISRQQRRILYEVALCSWLQCHNPIVDTANWWLTEGSVVLDSRVSCDPSMALEWCWYGVSSGNDDLGSESGTKGATYSKGSVLYALGLINAGYKHYDPCVWCGASLALGVACAGAGIQVRL